MSKLDETYRKIIEVLEKNIEDKQELNSAKEQIDKMVKDMIDNYDTIFEKYDKKIKILESLQIKSIQKINDLENRIREFEKLIELEDFDIFITCPYCGMEFQTDYDETIDEIPCPSCGESIDIDWSDNEN